MKYGDYQSSSYSFLSKKREKLMTSIETKLKTNKAISEFHELMEVERELTLREEDPY